jgi:hypothetical protein
MAAGTLVWKEDSSFFVAMVGPAACAAAIAAANRPTASGDNAARASAFGREARKAPCNANMIENLNRCGDELPRAMGRTQGPYQ